MIIPCNEQERTKEIMIRNKSLAANLERINKRESVFGKKRPNSRNSDSRGGFFGTGTS